MNDFPRLTEESCVDSEAECLYQYVYGEKDRFNPHCHDFFEIFITIKGTVGHSVNGVLQHLPEGSLVFIRPDDVHANFYDTPESRDTAFINLAFSRNTTEELFRYLSGSFPSDKLLSSPMPPSVILSTREKKRLIGQISELNIVNWSDKNSLKLRLRTILADIFVRHFSDFTTTDSNDIPLWLCLLLDEMERPENFTSGAEKMLELSGKSREHLSRSVKKHLGITVSDYINDLRLNYASNLLLHTNRTVINICYSCGFQSVSYFYEKFREKNGISPNDFRKQKKL